MKTIQKINNAKIAQSVGGIVLSILALYIIGSSSIEDITFVLFKKRAVAQIVSVTENGTSKKPFVVGVEYIDEKLVHDIIFVDQKFGKILYKGQIQDVFYSDFFQRNTYFVNNTFPGIFIFLMQLICNLSILLVLYSSAKNIYTYLKST